MNGAPVMSNVKRIFVATAAAAVLGVTVQSASAFQLAGRWPGAQGDATTLTWSILPDGTPITGFNGEPDSPSNLVSQFRSFYGVTHADPAAATADTDYTDEAWFGQMKSSFDRWSSVSGLSLTYQANDDGSTFLTSPGSATRGDIRIGGHTIDGPGVVLAYNYLPNFGDGVIDTADNFGPASQGNDSRKLRNLVAHEVGHGLGLLHTEGIANNLLNRTTSSNPPFDGPQLDDILGIQRHYGDANEKGAGNDTTGTATNLGALASGVPVAIGADAVDQEVGRYETDFVSIDSATDTDVFMFTVGADGMLTALLDPLGPTQRFGKAGDSTLYDYAAFGDLTVELLDAGGSVIAWDNDGLLGAGEELTDIALLAGDYFIRIGGADFVDLGGDSTAQFYGLSLAFTEEAETEPPVSVSEPGMAILFLMSIGAIGLRRRKK
ncbi:MAG: hypothetical protein ACI9JL_002623 [Paracoccaceae bacterium]|jgi:hypothetical protein